MLANARINIKVNSYLLKWLLRALKKMTWRVIGTQISLHFFLITGHFYVSLPNILKHDLGYTKCICVNKDWTIHLWFHILNSTTKTTLTQSRYVSMFFQLDCVNFGKNMLFSVQIILQKRNQTHNEEIRECGNSLTLNR